jgi:hypothetical protein
MARFEIIDSRTVRDADGREHDVLAAVAVLPWVRQLCPSMPHEYAVMYKSEPVAFGVVETMTSSRNPDSYLAYFRGYERPNRYWDAPDGLRYWRTREMNRCDPASVESLRRKDAGAQPATDWDGPRWAPSGGGLYVSDGKGKWWPTLEAIAGGYEPCRACQRRPKDLDG